MTRVGSVFAWSQIGQTCVNVHDLDRTTTLYRDALGCG